VYSHQAFAKELGGLPFELIADFERKMVNDYGVRRDDVAGYSGMAKRVVYIIDKTGNWQLTFVTGIALLMFGAILAFWMNVNEEFTDESTPALAKTVVVEPAV